jgi:hypothetical protein
VAGCARLGTSCSVRYPLRSSADQLVVCHFPVTLLFWHEISRHNEILKLFVNANRRLPRQGRLDPGLCRHEVQHKADPECDPEEFIRRQA